jgi:hypothetical protein
MILFISGRTHLTLALADSIHLAIEFISLILLPIAFTSNSWKTTRRLEQVPPARLIIHNKGVKL